MKNIINPEKTFWPKITKQDLMDYYEQAADLILPYLKDRPIAVKRCPDGIKKGCWFQKDFSVFKNIPNFVHLWPRFSLSTGQSVFYCLVQNKTTLLWLVNLASVEFHTWFSTTKNPSKPDWIIFDLDLTKKANINDLKEAALILKQEIFKKWKLKSYLKTTGIKGLHVLIPVRPQITYQRIRAILKNFLLELKEKYPLRFATEQRIEKRQGKIYLDISQNSLGKLMIVPWSVRAFSQFSISQPLSWKDLKKYDYRRYPAFQQIINNLKNPWSKIVRQSIKE